MPKSAKILKDKSSVGEWLSLRGKILLKVSAVLSPVVALSAVKSALILWSTNVVPMAANLFIGAMALAVVPGVTMLISGRVLEKRDSRKRHGVILTTHKDWRTLANITVAGAPG